MKKKQKNLLALLSLMMTGGLFMTSCMDDNYDLSDIDGTVAVGSDEGITLPSNNSTTNITLSDLLDIDESESVTTDVDGNYQYEQSSTIDDVNDIKVDKITLAKSGDPIENPVDLTGVEPFPDIVPDGTEADYTGGQIYGEIETFSYQTEKQDDVVDLASADLEGVMTLRVYFSSKLRAVVETIDEMSIELPPFMEFDVLNMSTNAERSGNTIKFTNQLTDNDANVTINVKKLDFAAEKNTVDNNSIKFNSETKKISLKGIVHVKADIAKIKKRTIADDSYPSAAIRSTLTINDITINGATGKFDPDITIENSTIDLDDLPDFMTDDEVVVDLYNPQIIFTANSQLPLPGKINAKLKAKKNGSVIKTVTIPEFLVEQNKANKILIARRNENIPTDLTQPAIIVPDLSEIIKDVPDNIELSIEAKADSENDYDFELGTSYSITDINYIIHAPLSFGDEALIVYNDTIDGWAEDMEDIYLTDNAKVEATFDITNNVPAKLTLEATPIDAKGNDIDNMLNIENPPTVDKGVTNGVKFTITQKNKDALKKLDGLRFKIKAKPIDNTTLNEKTQTIKIENISIKVIGKVVIEDNKD